MQRGVTADWVVTGKPDQTPLAGGAVVVDGAGRIEALGPAGDLKTRYPDARWDHVRGVVLPGLVNAHTHLELSALKGQVPGGAGFAPWAKAMLERRRELSPEADLEAIDAGVSALLRAGTAAVGEVTNTLAALPLLATAPLLGRVFHEVFGLSEQAGRGMLEAALRARAERELPANLSWALCPHTLHTLHPSVVREVMQQVRSAGERSSLHLLEHSAERFFLRDGTGPFADFVASIGASREGFTPPGTDPVSYAASLGVLAPDVLLVHLCGATREELSRVVDSGAQAVLCPRSNLFIELKLPPLFDMLEAGLLPALGTDSLASNTSLDVLAEAAALHARFPQVEAARVFAMATWYGALALGLSHRVGALAEGLAPGILAVDLDKPVDDPFRVLLRSPPPARRVLCRPALPEGQKTLGDAP